MILKKQWQLCIMLFLATTLNYLDRQTLSILAPSLQKEMHLDNEALGWLFAIFYYAYTFSQMVVGPILDRVNLRWAFAIAVSLWSFVSGLTGLANGFVALLIFRLSLGVVESANWPGGLRLVARLLEPKERALGNGIFTSGTSVGGADRARLDSGHCRPFRVAVGIRAHRLSRLLLGLRLAPRHARSKVGPRLARSGNAGERWDSRGNFEFSGALSEASAFCLSLWLPSW